MSEERIQSDGALPDARSEKEKAKDYLVDEIMPAGAAQPFANPKPTVLKATVYSQEYTNSCVPHGFLTQLEYEGCIPAGGISQILAYRKRSNYPAAGSGSVDMYTQIADGQVRNSFQPVTPGMTDVIANGLARYRGEKLIKDFNYFAYTNYSLVPADVASGRAISIFIYATEAEWAQEYVEIKDPNLNVNTAPVRHCVCIVPRGDFTENGKQWLAVHDSAKFGGRHLRYMSLDFFLKRVYYAARVEPKAPTPPLPPAPIQKPLTVCELGNRGDAVLTLQKYLASKLYLEPQYITGYYGNITAKAVLWFQLEHWDKFQGGVPQLLSYAGRYWGKQSVDVVQSL